MFESMKQPHVAVGVVALVGGAYADVSAMALKQSRGGTST